MKLGVNSVLFGGHDMETAFKYTQLCGYDGIEISAIDGMSEHLVLDRWKEIAPRAFRRTRSMDRGRKDSQRKRFFKPRLSRWRTVRS